MRYNTRKISNTRKINKYKHKNKYLQKRKSRRQYGGEIEQENNEDVDEILDKIDEQNKIEFPPINEIPIIGPVIEKTGNLVKRSLEKGLENVAASIGVNIDEPGSISEKLNNIKTELSNPENVKITKEILSNAGKYIEVGIEAASPVFEKTMDKLLPVVTKEADKAIEAAKATGVNLFEDVAGPLIGIPRTILSAVEAFNASVNAGSELIEGVAETVQGTQENYKRLINEKNPLNLIKPPEIPNTNYNYQAQSAGGSLKKLHKEALIIGGRTRKSHLDFLAPHVNRSQILRQYGGTLIDNKTKKRRRR